MSFGLINNGATYSRLQKIVLNGAKSIANFVDDVICATNKFDEHLLSQRHVQSPEASIFDVETK